MLPPAEQVGMGPKLAKNECGANWTSSKKLCAATSLLTKIDQNPLLNDLVVTVSQVSLPQQISQDLDFRTRSSPGSMKLKTTRPMASSQLNSKILSPATDCPRSRHPRKVLPGLDEVGRHIFTIQIIMGLCFFFHIFSFLKTLDFAVTRSSPDSCRFAIAEEQTVGL